MQRRYCHWHSPALGREMELLVFGHAGARVLAFPTRDGRFYEYENLGIIERLRDKIEAGYLQVFCLENFAHDSLYNFALPGREKVLRHLAYERYVLEEAVPFSHSLNPDGCLISLGLSLGAYAATNIALRHPGRFCKLVALSGRHDLTLEIEHFHDLFGGYYDEDIYFNTPSHFLPGLEDPRILADLRRLDIVLAVGLEDPFLDNNRHLSQTLAAKGVAHRFYEWGGRAHRGSAWRKMVPLYL